MNRGWPASHARVVFEVWLEPLSITRWIFRLGWIAWSIWDRNQMKFSELFRPGMISPRTWPVATSIAAIRLTVPWRTYSNSRWASRPGRTGRVG